MVIYGDVNVKRSKINRNRHYKINNVIKDDILEAGNVPFTRITPKAISSIDVCLTNLGLQNSKLKTHKIKMTFHLGDSFTVDKSCISTENKQKKKDYTY